MDEMTSPLEGIEPGVNLGPLEPPEIPQNLQRMIDYCMGLYEAFSESSYRKEKMDEARKSRKAYALKSETAPIWDNASNEIMPFVLMTVDNLEPRIHAALVGREPIVEFEMDGLTEKDDVTKLIQHWFNQELKNVVKIDTKTMSLVHDLLLDGTVFVLPKYEIREQMRREFVFDQTGAPVADESMRPAVREVVDLRHNGGSLESIPMQDMFFPDDIGTIEEWEACPKVRRVRPTYAELMRVRDGRGYMNIGPWLCGKKETLKLSSDEKNSSQSPSQAIAGVEVTGKEVIDCLEFHVSYPIFRDDVNKEESEQDDFREERIVLTLAEHTRTPIRLIRLIDLNMSNDCQIKRMRLFPEDGQSYGSPVYAKLKSVQNVGSDMFNQLINSAMIAMVPWFLYDDRSGLASKVQISPGAGVPVDNVEGIKFAQFQAMPQAFLSFLQLVTSMWERIGNIGDLQIGRPSETAGKSKTATEVMAVIQEGNIKYNYQARTMKEEYIEILRSLYDLYYQHMPFDRQVLYGGRFVAIPKAMMRRKFKFNLTGSSETANRLIERKEAEDLYQLSASNPLMNPVKTLEDLLKAYGRTNTKEYIQPQAAQLLAALNANPEILQVVGSYLQTKENTAKEITGGGQAAQGIRPNGGRSAMVQGREAA